MYAGEEGSELFAGIGTDRFILSWKIAGERVARALADRRAGAAAALPRRAGGQSGRESIAELSDAPRVRVEIPPSIQDFKAARPDAAPAWRESTRRAFEHYLARGYRVEAFYRDADQHCFYGLERD